MTAHHRGPKSSNVAFLRLLRDALANGVTRQELCHVARASMSTVRAWDDAGSGPRDEAQRARLVSYMEQRALTERWER